MLFIPIEFLTLTVSIYMLFKLYIFPKPEKIVFIFLVLEHKV